MDVKAIVLAGGSNATEHIAGVPIGLLDVLGEPVVQRVLTRVEKLGVTSTAVVAEHGCPLPGVRTSLRSNVKFVEAVNGDFWRCAEQQFNDFAQQGAELILLIRIGPYTELDYEDFVQFHLDRGARVSVAVNAEGESLDRFIISASRRNDAAFLLRNELKRPRTPCESYLYTGYINPLENAADLRHLALDGFAGLNTITPAGTEIKPGVWVADSARVHPGARVLAPAFIGARAKIRASAVITRGSVIEHHAVVDCGTVVENSTVLPFTYIGAGLDVSISVVGFRQISNLRRNATVEIGDARLISMTTTSAPLRTIGTAMDLVTFVPRSLVAGLRRSRNVPQSIPEAVAKPSAALASVPEDSSGQPTVASFQPNLMSARRYGNE